MIDRILEWVALRWRAWVTRGLTVGAPCPVCGLRVTEWCVKCGRGR